MTPRISSISRCLRTLPAAFVLLASAAHAQAPAANPNTAAADTTVEDALHRMSDQAGIVFVGEVIAIRRHPGEDGASGIVEVDFRIDQAVRGSTAGGTFTLREWAGLWTGGDRYNVGQRLLMLLHNPGPTGITSPVGGMAGAIPIRGSATSPHANESSAAPVPPIADLRWVGTRLVRSVVYRSNSAPLATATGEPAPADASEASTAAQQAPVSVVVDMLTSWQKVRHDLP
jgi:hypothetical protein